MPTRSFTPAAPAAFLTLFALVVASLAADPTCATQRVPFNQSLVGHTYSYAEYCERPLSYSLLRVHQTFITYVPVTYTQALLCDETYKLRFRPPPLHPFIVHFPQIYNASIHSTPELNRFCRTVHRTAAALYRPSGNTRARFEAALQNITQGAARIRDFACPDEATAALLQYSPEVDGIVAFLMGLAYRFGMCV